MDASLRLFSLIEVVIVMQRWFIIRWLTIVSLFFNESEVTCNRENPRNTQQKWNLQLDREYAES